MFQINSILNNNNIRLHNDTAKQCGLNRDPSAMIDKYSVKKILFDFKKKFNLFLKELIYFSLTIYWLVEYSISRLLKNKRRCSNYQIFIFKVI